MIPGVVLALLLTAGAWPARAEEAAGAGDADALCRSAEDCFRSVSALKLSTVTGDRRRMQVERLRLVRERFPDSPWASRAGALMGLLLVEQDPAEAARLLEGMRPALPVLDDYLRFWQAEALLRAGQAAEAAALHEALARAQGDSLLRNRAAFAGGHAWFKAGDCKKATELLEQAVATDPADPAAAAALLATADCLARDGDAAGGRATLRQIWVKYPRGAPAREALTRLQQLAEGAVWSPAPEDYYERALAFLNLSLHAEAAEDLKKFLAAAPAHARRDEAKLKLGSALLRLKRYDQARAVFQEILAQRGEGADEAAVFLARVYLRQGDGDRLAALRDALPTVALSGEQRSAILLMVGTWFDDQGRADEAIAAYRQAAKEGASPSQRIEALWRIGWIHYRKEQWREAAERLEEAGGGAQDSQWMPLLLYWRARALERQSDVRAAELYQQVCRRYALTYYCQLVRGRAGAALLLPEAPAPSAGITGPFRAEARQELEGDLHYRKAMELKHLRQEQEAARELASVAERYARDSGALLALTGLLSEAGAHHEALRIARINFRDSLERGSDPVPAGFWAVAYPTVHLVTIRTYAGSRVDPYLAAAIIREESQYDSRAVSRAGALGLMQVMPETAKAVARRIGLAEGTREDLFTPETNIRYGTGYLDQLLEQYGGNVVYAVAAYNAGPAAVSSWIAKNGARDLEEFVELIPYQETRQYVKRVLRSYREYRRLNGESCRFGALDKVC
jgi:soluble lytic murein transglycosylase